MILINSNTRQFNVPGADLVFGVVADSDAERKHFQCPRYVGDNLDLASCFIRINYRNANGKTDFYLVDDMVIDGDNITFSWLLSPKVTEYRGQIKFVMCAVGPDLKLKWHTTQGTGQVMEGLEPDNSHVESQTADVVAQLIAMVEAQTTAVEVVGADQVTAVKTAAKTAQGSAVAEIEAKRTNSLNSIPSDYTALSATADTLVRETAPGIVCSAEGEVITLNDASNQAFRGMRIFGKSTQDGIPTPENPVEIVSVGDSGSVGVNVCGKNLLDSSVLTFGFDGKKQYDDIVQCPAEAFNPVAGITYTLSFDTANTGISAYVNGVFTGTGKSSFFTMDGKRKSVTWCNEAEYKRESVAVITRMSETSDVANGAISNIQIEVGSISTAFEPFAGGAVNISTTHSLPGIPVASGGNYTDANGQQWICDEVDFARGVYVQRVYKLALDTIESWRKTDTDEIFQVTTVIPFDSQWIEGLCTHFRVMKWYNTAFNPYIRMVESGKQIYFEGDAEKHTTAEDWTSFLAEQAENGTPVELQYILATPIETPLSETDLAAYRALHTNKPNTTILNDSGAYMSVDYTADTRLYIDNKIKEALL